MTTYLVLIFLIFVGGLGIQPRRSPQSRKVFLIFSFILLFVISAFRDYSVGADTRSYVGLFKNIDYIDFTKSRYENGFLEYLKIIHHISNNPTFLLAVSSIICIGTACVFVYKYSYDPLLSILLYIQLDPFFFQMTGMRQALATAIVMMGFSFIITEFSLWRIIVSFLFLVLAMQFHSMSLIAFVPFAIWCIQKAKNRNRNSDEIKYLHPQKIVLLTIAVALIGFVVFPLIQRVIGIMLPNFASYSSSVWGESNYFASFFQNLIEFVFLVVGAIYLKNYELSEIDKFGFMMVAFATIITTLSMRMEIWGRLTGMFSIYTATIFAPSFATVEMDRRNRIILKGLICLGAFLYMVVVFIFRPEWESVVPYVFRYHFFG